MLISKYDIVEAYKVSENIPDYQINPFIKDAELFDIETLLPEGMFNAITRQLPKPQIAWDRNKTYSADNVIFHIDRFYICVTGNADSEPTAENDNWTEAELLNFWLTYIKPILIYQSIYRFTLEHGINFTQFGLRTNNEETSNEITDKRRSEIRASFKSKVDHFTTLFSKELSRVNGTFDEVKYEYTSCESKPKKSFGIYQAGSAKRDNDELYYR